MKYWKECENEATNSLEIIFICNRLLILCWNSIKEIHIECRIDMFSNLHQILNDPTQQQQQKQQKVSS